MSDNTDIRMILEAFDAIDAVVVKEGWGASGQQRMKDEMTAEKEKYLEKIKKEKPEAVSNYNMWCQNGWRGAAAYERAMQGKIHPQEKKRLSTGNPTEGKHMKKTKKVAEASEAQKAARANFKDMINKKKTDKKDDKKDKVDDKKDDKKDDDEVDESLSFKQLIKLVRESGGQQRIDPIDEALFTWAQRVAASKFEESTKQEVYAGLVYERMGGVFQLHDVLSESTDKKLPSKADPKTMRILTRNYDINSSLDKYSDSPSATKFLRSVIDRSSPDNFSGDVIQKARELKAADFKNNDK